MSLVFTASADNTATRTPLPPAVSCSATRCAVPPKISQVPVHAAAGDGLCATATPTRHPNGAYDANSGSIAVAPLQVSPRRDPASGTASAWNVAAIVTP